MSQFLQCDPKHLIEEHTGPMDVVLLLEFDSLPGQEKKGQPSRPQDSNGASLHKKHCNPF